MNHISKIVYADINDIVPNPLNPREDNSTKTEEMQRIIKTKGWESPITCYQDGSKYVIFSGHRRWYAAQKLSLKTIPVFLVRPPSSPEEELERLGSVQGGKADWSVYEWAKYAYEMWIYWKECSFKELARKINKSSGFVAIRVNIFRYFPHNEIEERLINGVYSISILHYLISWLENLNRLKPGIVEALTLDLIRTTMLTKIERKLVTILDLKSDLFIRNANDEQIKDFFIQTTKKLSDALADLGEGYEMYRGKSKRNVNIDVINNAQDIVGKFPTPHTKEARLLLEDIINQYETILISKINELESFLQREA
ncbi:MULTISPECIES: ParB/RepB/Spo0J family partition protein [Paenibacillus]|uniref:ParB/RepB/Spo0J family partition protein n=1 Tax=Paenibacillus TaxID=44249 RepID=UPI00048E5D2C|nr:ParB N-terminal domain-containing protein [Paenibacillus sp. IHBB 10380]